MLIKTHSCRLLSTLLALFSALLIVLGLVQELPLALCIEPNGRVELEAITPKGTCVDWQADIQRVSVSGILRHCVDVPLSQVSTGKMVLKASTASISRLWSNTFVLQGLIEFCQWGMARTEQASRLAQWNKPPPIALAALAVLKTIILLL